MVYRVRVLGFHLLPPLLVLHPLCSRFYLGRRRNPNRRTPGCLMSSVSFAMTVRSPSVPSIGDTIVVFADRSFATTAQRTAFLALLLGTTDRFGFATIASRTFKWEAPHGRASQEQLIPLLRSPTSPQIRRSIHREVESRREGLKRVGLRVTRHNGSCSFTFVLSPFVFCPEPKTEVFLSKSLKPVTLSVNPNDSLNAESAIPTSSS